MGHLIDDLMEYYHQPWCAAVIAENAELFWRVKCDCKPPKPKKPKPIPLFEEVDADE